MPRLSLKENAQGTRQDIHAKDVNFADPASCTCGTGRIAVSNCACSHTTENRPGEVERVRLVRIEAIKGLCFTGQTREI